MDIYGAMSGINKGISGTLAYFESPEIFCNQKHQLFCMEKHFYEKSRVDYFFALNFDPSVACKKLCSSSGLPLVKYSLSTKYAWFGAVYR